MKKKKKKLINWINAHQSYNLLNNFNLKIKQNPFVKI
jgi:hypothetical protein